MDMNIETLRALCERRGWDSRKYRFNAISEILGISPEEAKEVEKITRYFREIFPIDEVGIEKEKEYHKPLSQIIYEKQAERIVKLI
jgi:broad-specificity NMP kinase